MPTDPDNPADFDSLEEFEPPEAKRPRGAADLFPFDELSTGETSSLLRRARLVTGLQDDPAPAVDPSLKPTTGRFLALKAAASMAGTSKPVTGTQPAYTPGTGQAPAFEPPAHVTAGRPGTGSHAALDPAALQREIRQKVLHGGTGGPVPGARPSRPVKPPLAAEDTFVKKKMRQAERNLPDWDFDDEGDDEGG
jgi:hypothetical protein